ncbi:MAG: helix-turn-helix transcriptional regulator [Candidatus Methanomethyliaceae archaeon]
MPIDVRLSAMMGTRKIRSINRLHELTGISRTTLTTLWYGRAKGISFDTLETLCKALNCQPGDLLVYVSDENQKGEGQ